MIIVRSMRFDVYLCLLIRHAQRALYVEEILLNIFVHCHSLNDRAWGPGLPQYANRHLAAIARTCQTFKDLALDMIWAELPNLTPLVRCLPNVSSVDSLGVYSFQRQLENAEWETLRNYTSRLSNPPNPAEPFFPKLQTLGLDKISAELYPFVLCHFTNSQLTNLTLAITGSHGSIFRSFGHLCPNLDYFKAIESGPHADIISDLVCHWSIIRHVICHSVALNFTALSHLSILSTVLSLAFTVNDTLIDQFPDTLSLPFSSLNALSVNAGSLVPLWRMFRRIDLPVLHTIHLSPSQVHFTRADLLSMFRALGEACSHESLNNLTIWVPEDEIVAMDDPPPFQLTFDLDRPLAVFHNLQSISLGGIFGMDGDESELLGLASLWPRVTSLDLGERGDWTPSSGLTPNGFVQLLERCRSLRTLFVILNTQGYTQIPQGHPWRGLTMPKDTFIHLLHSPIEENALEALGVFFQVAPYPHFTLTTHWNNLYFNGRRPRVQESTGTYYWRWSRARDLARKLSESRRKLLESIKIRTSRSGSTEDPDVSTSDSDR